jgi:hypothetical protein
MTGAESTQRAVCKRLPGSSESRCWPGRSDAVEARFPRRVEISVCAGSRPWTFNNGSECGRTRLSHILDGPVHGQAVFYATFLPLHAGSKTSSPPHPKLFLCPSDLGLDPRTPTDTGFKDGRTVARAATNESVVCAFSTPALSRGRPFPALGHGGTAGCATRAERMEGFTAPSRHR